MNNLLAVSKKEIFPISLILFLSLFRIIPHPWNFTPIIAVAIMSSYFFKNIYLSYLVLLVSMLLSDVFIGFYEGMYFTYISLFLITFIFFRINKKINTKSLFIFSFFGSLIFYLASNFGVWILSGMYEKNLNGLLTCYVLAIPFFKNTFLSTIIFSYTAFFANDFYNKKFLQKKYR
tara:strand:- start:258 stop:785 length:528 start_codon:yes stop_codon:yes gene_type:complete